MPQAVERLANIGAPIQLFPDPSFKRVYEAIALGASEGPKPERPKRSSEEEFPVSASSKFGLWLPDIEKAMPLDAHVTTPVENWGKWPLKYYMNKLELGIHNWNHDLYEIGFGKHITGEGAIRYDYSEDDLAKLLKFALVLEGSPGRYVSFPTLDGKYQQGLTFGTFQKVNERWQLHQLPEMLEGFHSGSKARKFRFAKDEETLKSFYATFFRVPA